MRKKIHFTSALNKILPLPKNAMEEFNSLIDVNIHAKNEIVLKKGAVSDKLYYIRSGLLHSSIIVNGKKLSNWVNWEGDVAISIASFFNQSPSKEQIDCLEDTILESITYKNLQYIVEKYSELRIIYTHFLENYLSRTDHRVIIARIPNSVDRLNYFLKYYDREFFNRVPKGILASILNIRPETLSRLLAKIK